MPLPIPLVVKKGSVARFSVFFVHPRASIAHGKADVGAGFQPVVVARAQNFLSRRDDDLASIRHGVARIHGEIEQYHFKLVCVTQHRLAHQRKVRLYDN